jgi:hypothetical protein
MLAQLSGRTWACAVAPVGRVPSRGVRRLSPPESFGAHSLTFRLRPCVHPATTTQSKVVEKSVPSVMPQWRVPAQAFHPPPCRLGSRKQSPGHFTKCCRVPSKAREPNIRESNPVAPAGCCRGRRTSTGNPFPACWARVRTRSGLARVRHTPRRLLIRNPRRSSTGARFRRLREERYPDPHVSF